MEHVFPANQSSCETWKLIQEKPACCTGEGELELLMEEPLIVPRSNDAHSWTTLAICSVTLNNSWAPFTCQAASRCPVGSSGTRSISMQGMRAEPGASRLTLFRRTALLLSANRDPVTYRPNINNSGSVPPHPFLRQSKPASVPHCYTRPAGFGCRGRIFGQPDRCKDSGGTLPLTYTF